MRFIILLTFFASAAVAQVRQGTWTPSIESMRRGYSSISYWTYREDGVEIGGGRISIEHGLPAWRPELDDPEVFDRATKGKFYRLGNNKWTTLDTNLTLELGERRVDPGIYYLAVERGTEGKWALVFVEPKAVHRKLIDSWAFVPRPTEVPVMFTVPLQHSRAPDRAAELRIDPGLVKEEPSRGWIQIHWGPHVLECHMKIQMVSPEFYRATREDSQ